MSLKRLMLMLGVGAVMAGSGSLAMMPKEEEQPKDWKPEFNDAELEYIRSLPKKERQKAVKFLRQEKWREHTEKKSTT